MIENPRELGATQQERDTEEKEKLTPEQRRYLAKFKGVNRVYFRAEVERIRTTGKTAKELCDHHYKRAATLAAVITAASTMLALGQGALAQLREQQKHEADAAKFYESQIGKSWISERQIELLRVCLWAGAKIGDEIKKDDPIVLMFRWAWEKISGKELAYDQVRKILYKFHKLYPIGRVVIRLDESKIEVRPRWRSPLV